MSVENVRLVIQYRKEPCPQRRIQSYYDENLWEGFVVVSARNEALFAPFVGRTKGREDVSVSGPLYGGEEWSFLKTFFISLDFSFASLFPSLRHIWSLHPIGTTQSACWREVERIDFFTIDMVSLPYRLVFTISYVALVCLFGADRGHFFPLAHPAYTALVDSLVVINEKDRQVHLSLLKKIFQERMYCLFFLERTKGEKLTKVRYASFSPFYNSYCLNNTRVKLTYLDPSSKREALFKSAKCIHCDLTGSSC